MSTVACCWETNKLYKKDNNVTAAGQAQGLRVPARTCSLPAPDYRDRDRDRQRQRQRFFWVHCQLRAIPSVWLLFLLCYGPFSLRALRSFMNG